MYVYSQLHVPQYTRHAFHNVYIRAQEIEKSKILDTFNKTYEVLAVHSFWGLIIAPDQKASGNN